ncbi:MAG: TetR/AcrR family transcriptional regulator [Verrucomicrobiota bacterium]
MKPECESKCKLLRVAMRLIAENSYGSVSVDDICTAAGVKKGSFYYFFPSKSDLTVAAMEADWRENQPDYDRLFSSQTPPLERIRQYCDASLRCHTAEQDQNGKILGCPMITLGAELSTRDEKIRLKTVEIMNRYIRYFESAVRDAAALGEIRTTDPAALARDLFAYFQGSMLAAKVGNDLAPLRGMREGMTRLLTGRPQLEAD